MSEEIDHYMKWCAKMRGNNMEKDLTTINIERKTFKTLLDIKYTMGFKSMNDVIKFLLSGKKQK